MADRMITRLPEQVNTNILTEWFEQEPSPVYDNTLPVRAVDLPDEDFWASSYERNTYKLGKDGTPLPLSLSTPDYHDDLVTGFMLDNQTDDTVFNMNHYA